MPSFTVKSRWGDQTQQGGGETAEAYGTKKGSLDQHASAYCGSNGIRCGGPANPSLDAAARDALELPTSYTKGGQEYPPEPLVQATLDSGKEHGVVILNGGPNGGYSHSEVFEGGPYDVEYSWKSSDSPAALVHAHQSVEAPATFSVGDITTANRYGLPAYVALPNGEILVYTPDAVGGHTGAMRALPTD
jgi:hypothetical protein